MIQITLKTEVQAAPVTVFGQRMWRATILGTYFGCGDTREEAGQKAVMAAETDLHATIVEATPNEKKEKVFRQDWRDQSWVEGLR